MQKKGNRKTKKIVKRRKHKYFNEEISEFLRSIKYSFGQSRQQLTNNIKYNHNTSKQIPINLSDQNQQIKSVIQGIFKIHDDICATLDKQQKLQKQISYAMQQIINKIQTIHNSIYQYQLIDGPVIYLNTIKAIIQAHLRKIENDQIYQFGFTIIKPQTKFCHYSIRPNSQIDQSFYDYLINSSLNRFNSSIDYLSLGSKFNLISGDNHQIHPRIQLDYSEVSQFAIRGIQQDL